MLSADPHSGRSVEEYEAFNPKLWEKAKEMARMEEDLIEEIAGLRRKMPGVAVENVKRGFEGVGKDEEILKRWGEREAEREGESMKLGKGGNVLGVGSLERQEDVEKNWQRGVEGLGRLRGSMPEMVARKERAERAEKHVLEMR
jgi:kinetochor protein Mis14/NSL1